MLRKCSESGFVPALLARIASRGSLISGFCGAGSADFGFSGSFDDVGSGASLMAGPERSRSFSRSLTFSFFFPFPPASRARSFLPDVRRLQFRQTWRTVGGSGGFSASGGFSCGFAGSTGIFPGTVPLGQCSLPGEMRRMGRRGRRNPSGPPTGWMAGSTPARPPLRARDRR